MPPRRRHRLREAPPATAGARRVGPLLIIDGRNVQRALERGSAPGSLPASALIARLRGAFQDVELELVFDGHASGSPSGPVAPGLIVTYSRHVTADQVIGERVADAARSLGPAGAWSVTVVSDDREVRDQALRHGARVESTAWLGERLAPHRQAGAIGHGRAPRPSGGRTPPNARVD